LLRVAQATDDQFSQLVGRLKGQGDDVSGELVVTSLATLAPMMVPVLTEFQEQHPGLILRYLTGDRLFRLEYGEAHVAVRAGAAPDQPDNVVQPFVKQRIGLYASKEYVARHGLLKGFEDFANHRFIGTDDEGSRAPFNKWLREHATNDAITFRCTNGFTMHEAVQCGAGIGFMSVWEAARHPDLVQMMEPQPEWEGSLWLVTHVDLHRTTKVQTFLTFLKDHAKGWCK
jgi:DNA-binding transcriptional LysR family regulator